MSKLHELQKNVHVAKDKRNNFGKYNYRTAEGILAVVKQHLPKGAFITLTDRIEQIGDHLFLCATATITFDDEGCVSTTAYAGHPLEKKGMDFSQITGAASSYARKYALQGLLSLDDGSVDPDATSSKNKQKFIEASDQEKQTVKNLMMNALPHDREKVMSWIQKRGFDGIDYLDQASAKIIITQLSQKEEADA